MLQPNQATDETNATNTTKAHNKEANPSTHAKAVVEHHTMVRPSPAKTVLHSIKYAAAAASRAISARSA